MERILMRKWQFGLVMVTLLVTVLMSGCAGALTAKTGDTVKVDYTGKLADGTVFDSSIGKTPIEFTIGSGEIIKGFDNAVLGMKVGQSKTVVLAPEDAYGAHRDDLVITFDKSQVEPGVNPTVGQQLTDLPPIVVPPLMLVP
jgi:hypothetical protein